MKPNQSSFLSAGRRVWRRVWENPLLGIPALYVAQLGLAFVVNRIPVRSQEIGDGRALVASKQMVGCWIPGLGLLGLLTGYAVYYVDDRGRVFLSGGYDILDDTGV